VWCMQGEPHAGFNTLGGGDGPLLFSGLSGPTQRTGRLAVLATSAAPILAGAGRPASIRPGRLR